MVLSESGYINKGISLIFLDYIAKHINAGLDKPPKVLLIDCHSSYIDKDFTIKVTSYNIYLYPFPGYLIHVL